MKYQFLGKSKLNVSAVGVGCMRMAGMDSDSCEKFIAKAFELGINFFDHADIYGGGKCEEVFAEGLKNLIDAKFLKRQDIVLQSKCGIVPGKMYDFSESHILQSVDGILSRLKTDYIDVLVLHRPDTLFEGEEVASAFEKLQKSGKVLHFGVSNCNPLQIQLLQKYIKQDLIVNQMQFGLAHAKMISQGFEVNMNSEGSLCRDGSVLEFCRLNDITLQAWSPFQSDNGTGSFIDNDTYGNLNGVLWELCQKYGVSKTTIASAWILRHPAKIQLIAGTMNSNRLEEICKATDVTLTREEWYRLYLSAGNILP